MISSPYKTSTDIWTITLSFKLKDKDGNFLGVVIATLDPTKLMELLNSVFYAKDMRSSIVSDDGTLFLTNPTYPSILGTNLSKSDTFLTKHIENKQEVSISSGLNHIPNEDRLVVIHTINSKDLNTNRFLYVGVSRENSSLFSSFENEGFSFFFLYIVLLILSMPTLYILQKRRYKIKIYEIEIEDALKKRLESFAYIDGLTEISNRRYFDQVFEQEWRYCLRKQKPLSLILIDIDFFKNYNDFYGHQAGDKCLIEVAKALKSTLGHSHDFLARYGGEEFIVILPDTNLEGAKKIAELLRKNVNNLKIPHEKSLIHKNITISLGLCVVVPNENLSMENFLKKADEALYKSKETGRNKVNIEILN